MNSRKLFSILFVITMIIASSVASFAAVGELIPEPTIPVPVFDKELPDTASMTNDCFENVDSILVVGDNGLALPVPDGWEASITSDSNGSYGKIVSSNGYEIHLNLSSGGAFNTAYIDTALRSHHKPIVTMESSPELRIDGKWLYFVKADNNTMWTLSYVDNGDWLPGHADTIGTDEYFNPSFMFGDQRAELYGFQGPYKVYNQCSLDAKMAAKIIKAIDIVNCD